ncbi:MAG: oxidoreductase, partial [Acidobacteriaceae bacterium]|nr:oxidoreductase [Acidobacteriaceae bacterium]
MRAIVLDKAEGGQKAEVRDFNEAELMDGDVTVRVTHSTINYKDGLANAGEFPAVRRWP